MSAEEMDHGSEAAVGFLIACGESTKGLEFAEEILDQMTPLVDLEVAWDAAGPIELRRDDGLSTAFIQFRAQPVAVERLVTEKSRKVDAVDQGRDTHAVMTLAGQEDEADEVS